MFHKQLLIVLTALFVAVSPSHAQQMGTIKNPEIAQFTSSAELSDFPTQMFNDANGGIYTIAEKRGGKEWVTKYDNALKQVFEKPFILPKSDYRLEIMEVLLWNGKPTLFYRGKRKKQVPQIFYIKVEADGTLGPLEQLGRFAETEEYLSSRLAFSPDSSKLLLYTELSEDKNDLMMYKIYDKDLKEIWKTTSACSIFDMSATTTRAARTVQARPTCVIDNVGNFLAHFPVLRPDEAATKAEGDYFYQIYQFTQNTPQPKIHTVDYKGKVLHNFNLLPSKNPNEFIGHGTYTGSIKYKAYTTSNTDGGVMGTYRFVLNVATNELKQEPVQPFTDAIFKFMKVSDKRKEAGNGVEDWLVKLKKNIPPILFTFMVNKTIK